VSETEATELRQKAEEFQKEVETWIAANYPNLQ
jgi:hypothetical protein